MTAPGPLPAGEAWRHALRTAGDRPLLFDVAGKARSGAELADRITRLAGALAERGLVGRRIGLWYGNRFAAVEAFLAVEWLGGTRVPVDPGDPPSYAAAVFDAAGVDVVLADAEHGAALGGDTLVHDDDAPLTGSAFDTGPSVAPDTTLILYPREVTSGHLFAVTTSYAGWAATLRINSDLFRHGVYGPGFGSDECGLTLQQLMHGTGSVLSFPFLLMGLPQVLLPRFDADVALEAITRHRVTATFAVPGMLTRIADRLDAGADLPLRHSLYGGAPIGVPEIRRVRSLLGPSTVQLYGRFEAGWPLTVLGTAEHDAILAGDDEFGTSCGRPIPQVEMRLVDAPGQPEGYGELQTRNPMVSPEYADPQGWCGLGDVACFDARGYLHLAGRLDAMINTGSYHVYPGQVEEVIAVVPGVVAVKVVGEPDPVWGQAVTAYVVAQDADDWDALRERLRVELSRQLARYKIPKSFHQVAQLP